MGSKPFYKLQTPAYFWMQGSNVTQSSADPFWKLAPHPNDVILQQLRLCRSLLFQGIRDYLVMTFVVERQVLLWLCTISVLLTIAVACSSKSSVFGPAEDQTQHGRLWLHLQPGVLPIWGGSCALAPWASSRLGQILSLFGMLFGKNKMRLLVRLLLNYPSQKCARWIECPKFSSDTGTMRGRYF